MATNTVTWDQTEAIEWRAEFYETMAAAQRALLEASRAAKDTLQINIKGLFLRKPFKHLNAEIEKLITLLDKLDRSQSIIFVQDDARMIPDSLHDLFKQICSVIRGTESLGLHKAYCLKKKVVKLRETSLKISMFAMKFEDAQKKLLSRVPANDVEGYRTSFAAYANCRPQPSRGGHIDDLDLESVNQ